jgi:hypothetical protein
MSDTGAYWDVGRNGRRVLLPVAGLWMALQVCAVAHAAEAAAPAGDVGIRHAVTWIGVSLAGLAFINQDAHGTMSCAPTSVLNSMICGPPEVRRAYQELPGHDGREKLDGIIGTYGPLPSSVAGETLFSERRGMFADDIPTFADKIFAAQHLPLLVHATLRCHDRESPHHLLVRVQRMLISSLRAGVPVVTNLRLFSAVGEAGKELQWRDLHSHSILVVGVPDQEVRSFQQGLPFQYIDPSLASLQEGYLRCEYFQSHTVTTIDGKDHENTRYDFLQVIAPGLAFVDKPMTWSSRSYIDMDFAMGRFPTPPLLWTWSPTDVSETWHDVDIALAAHVDAGKPLDIEFAFISGQHRLDIRSVALLVDGKEVSRDQHDGSTGYENRGNDYRLVTTHAATGATAVLRASIRSDGGTDSHGEVRCLSE